MRIILVSDSFSVMSSAASIQLNDFVNELATRDGINSIFVLTPDYGERLGKISIKEKTRIKTILVGWPNTKSSNLITRFFLELLLPFILIYGVYKSKLAKKKFDLAIIYSPSIFLWPVYLFLKRTTSGKRFLILRDIFPQWAYETKLIKNKLIYLFLLWYSYRQYVLSDVILIQSQGDLKYFSTFKVAIKNKLLVLNNWLASTGSYSLCKNQELLQFIEHKFVFVYSGNLGPAQNSKFLEDLAQVLEHRRDCRLIIIGRGYGHDEINERIRSQGWEKSKVFSEIPVDELRSILKTCKVGVVSLNLMHKSNNIPGKFVSYLRENLPVLVLANEGSDLVELVKTNKLGHVFDGKYTVTDL